MKKLKLEVERVVFRNSRSGYSIIVGDDGQGGAVTVVGITHALPGETIEVEGEWGKHPQFGRQLNASKIRVESPKSMARLQKLLEHVFSGCAGEKAIRRILERFGSATVEVIERQPHRLLEIEGIGKRKAERMVSAWRAHRLAVTPSEIMEKFGLGPQVAKQCLEVIGKDFQAVIDDHPYLLCLLPDIDFAKADAIAKMCGIKEEDERRDQGVALAALEERIRRGHIGLVEGAFDRYAVRYLGKAWSDSRRERALRWCMDAGHATAMGPLVFHRRWFDVESECAGQVARRLDDGNPTRRKTWRIVIDGGIDLTDEQRKALALPGRHDLAILTGGPGTGKTSLLRALCRSAQGSGWKVIFAAPTGKAAKRLSESTGEPAYTVARLLHPYRTEALEADLLVVDEASMVDSGMLQRILSFTPETKLLLVGDRHQLPPVGPGQPLHDLLACKAVPAIALSRTFRQKESSPIITAARMVLGGSYPQIKSSEEFAILEAGSEEKINGLIDRLRERFGTLQILSPVRKGGCGINALNARLQEKIWGARRITLSNGVVRFGKGDVVIHVENNYDLNVMNGDMGEVKGIDPEKRTLTVAYDHGMVTYDESVMHQIDLAYALSVHKSQGSQFPGVIIVVDREHDFAWTRKMLYTAITRAQQRCFIVGSTETLRHIIEERRDRARLTWMGRALEKQSVEVAEAA